MKCFMNREFQQNPVQLILFAPFLQLCQLISHKIQLCTRVRIHIHIESSCLWKFPVVTTVHLLGDGCLSVDNLVMGQWQDIALIVKIHHRECQLVIFFLSFFCICLKIRQSIMHPSKVPFVIKSKSALPYRLCHTLIWSGILGKKEAVRDSFL